MHFSVCIQQINYALHVIMYYINNILYNNDSITDYNIFSAMTFRLFLSQNQNCFVPTTVMKIKNIYPKNVLLEYVAI